MSKLIVFEDEHLLVVNKPAGWNTHSPAPYAGEGIYEWLRHREPRWASLAIIHRLDKQTSGLMVFAKTTAANRSLTAQFSDRGVSKSYVLLTDRSPSEAEFETTSCLVRAGEKYISRPLHSGGERAVTCFKVISQEGPFWRLSARPETGRTHQIRVHAAAQGCPILGDTLYGGRNAPRLCLHAERLSFTHPATGKPLDFHAPADFTVDARSALREAIIDPTETNAFRHRHGASDGMSGWYVERLGEFLVSQSEEPWREAMGLELGAHGARGIYHKLLNRQVRRTDVAESSPQNVAGEHASERFAVRENGVAFELSFNEGYSVGLFLDQRDNRRRLLQNHVAAGFPLFGEGVRGKELLNTFAYTCAFSVCAGKAGMKTTSLDLSRKYLDWGRRNFALNEMDPGAHDFIFGDAFDWMRRLAKKGRHFDIVVLDPPTFSQSKEHGRFQAEKDYGKLVSTAVPLLRAGGILFASTNAARLSPEDFLHAVRGATAAAGRKVCAEFYAPQPPDFPVSREEPAYLKTVWLRLV